MTQKEKKSQEKKSGTKEEHLKWQKKTKNKGILDLLQPIVGNFILLIEEERKRTLDKVEKTKKILERKYR